MLKDPKTLVREIANQVGKHEAQRLLVSEGISTSTAQKLVANKYRAKGIGQLIRMAVERAYLAAKKMQDAS